MSTTIVKPLILKTKSISRAHGIEGGGHKSAWNRAEVFRGGKNDKIIFA